MFSIAWGIFTSWISSKVGGLSWNTVGKIALIASPIVALLIGYLAITGARADLKDITNENATLKVELRKLEARSLSDKRMIARRDEAIAQSQCKDQIQRWVRHPDEIPKKFDPHNQWNPFR